MIRARPVGELAKVGERSFATCNAIQKHDMKRVGEIATSVTYDGGLGSQSNGRIVGVKKRPRTPSHHPGSAVRAKNLGHGDTQCRSARYAVDAFGGVMREQFGQLNGSGQPELVTIAGTASAGLRAKGMWFDGGATNLYKTQTRAYAPDLARFTQVDPARAGTNWYAYCGGDPVNRMDQSGLDYVHVGIDIEGKPDDGAVLWLSDDFDGPSIGGFTKGGKSAIGRLDPSDPTMVILSGGNRSGRVSLAGLESLARNSHFKGTDSQFAPGVDLSISSLQLAVATAQQLMTTDSADLGDDVDMVDDWAAKRAAAMNWGPNVALPGLGKELAMSLLTMPGGPVDAALGKALGVAGEMFSTWRTARAAKGVANGGLAEARAASERVLGALVPAGSRMEAISAAFLKMTPSQAAWVRKFAEKNGITIVEGAARNQGGRIGKEATVRLTGALEGMDKRVLMEELQHAIDAKNGIIGSLESATKYLLNKNPRLSYAQAQALANESMHMGTFKRLAYNSDIPQDILSEYERAAIRLLTGD